MKNLILVFLLLWAKITFAQLDLPELSPIGKIHQEVGYTTIEVRYGRPAARERKLFGELVPYGRLWRTGAGPGTKISFSTDVTISEKTVKAGSYAFVTIPGEKQWTILLNSDTSKIYGDPSEYDTKTEALNFTVTPEKINKFVESLTINLDIKKYDAVLYLAWENTQIHFTIETGSHHKALSAIDRALATEPASQELLSTASYYYFMNNENSEQILTWLNRALEVGEERWILEQKVDVLERMKNYGEARKAATAAIEFLKRNKPDYWEAEISGYESRMKKWPAR